MFGLRSWDPVNTAIGRSSLDLALQDRQDLSTISSELIHYYEGNHLSYLYAYLARIIKDPYILETYQKLANFSNVTRLLVDRVATVGQQSIRVLWKDGNGASNSDDQTLWEEITHRWMGTASWDTFIPSVSQMTELCKAVVTRVGWNEDHHQLSLGYYTPNTIEVGYNPGNLEAAFPDRYHILVSEASSLHQVWDFSTKDPGASGIVYEQDGAGRGDPQPIEILDPFTGRSIVPFAVFRTRYSPHEFFVWDGQAEMKTAQEAINRGWTQISKLTHDGAFKMMIVAGQGWVAADGETVRIPTDSAKAIKVPDDAFGIETNPRNKVWWDGPDVSRDVEVILKVIGQQKEDLAAAFGISPKAITASNEPASGYSLLVDAATLRGKHIKSRNMAEVPLRRMVEAIRLIWNAKNKIGRYFSPGSTFEIYIPDYGTGVTTAEQAATAALLVEKGLSLRRTKILELNPGISDADLSQLLSQAVPLPINGGPPVGAPSDWKVYKADAASGGGA